MLKELLGSSEFFLAAIICNLSGSLPRSTVLRWSGLFLALLLLGRTAGTGAQQLLPSVRLRSGWQFQDASLVPQGAELVSRADYAVTNWHPALVPGTILSSLVHDGVYPDPLYGENNRPEKIPDNLCRASYWHCTVFIPPQGYAGKRIWLAFNDINYIAEVWVKGH